MTATPWTDNYQPVNQPDQKSMEAAYRLPMRNGSVYAMPMRNGSVYVPGPWHKAPLPYPPESIFRLWARVVKKQHCCFFTTLLFFYNIVVFLQQVVFSQQACCAEATVN